MYKVIFRFVLIAVLCVSVLAGCSQPSNTDAPASGTNTPVTTTPDGDTPSGPETIVVGGWPAADTAFEAIIPMFNEIYPDITVEMGTFMPSGDYHRELQAVLVAGSGAPDVTLVEEAHVMNFKDQGFLVNLLDAPYDAGRYQNDFVDVKWNSAVSTDGTSLSGLIWDIGPACYFYNKEVFAEVGLPTEPAEVEAYMSTWEGVLDVAEKVSIPGQRWFIPNAGDVFQWPSIGRDYYDKDLNLKFEKRPGFEGAMDAAMAIRQNGWDAQVELWADETYGYMNNGQLASVATGCWYGGFMKSWIAPDLAGKWGICRLPGGLPDMNFGGSYLCIPEQSQHKDAAWKFIEFALATKEAQNAMFEAVDYFPAYKPAWDDPMYEMEDPYFDNQKTRALWVDIASKMEAPEMPTPMDSDVEWILVHTFSDSMDGGLSKEEIIQAIKDQIADTTKPDRDRFIETLTNAGRWEQ